MGQPTPSIYLNKTAPAAPSGEQNIVFQSDNAAPQQAVTAYDPVMVGDTGSGGVAGNVPAPPAGSAAAGKFLKADGTFAVPAGSGGAVSSLTTTGSSGAATLSAGVLNIPVYSSGSSSTVIRTASSLGCALDCNLLTGAKIGGGTPTDNTVTINAFLATATATAPVKLIMDGGSACKGIKIPAGGHVAIEGIGLDSGFFVLTGANAHAIANEPGSGGSGYPVFDPNTTPPAQGANVTIRNLFINGNRGNGTTGNSTSGNPVGTSTTWYCGIDLISLADVLIEDVTLYDIAAYNIRLGNVTRWTVRGCTMNAPSAALHTDGVHVDGPAQDGVVEACRFLTLGDDSIALNAPEGYGGNIANTVVADCVFHACLTAVRCYSKGTGAQWSVSDITVSNCSGSVAHNGGVTAAVFFLGNGGAAVDAITSFKASNCTFASDGYYLKVADPCGDVVLDAQTWDSPTAANSFVWFDSAAGISSLTLAKCKIYRSAAGNAAAFGLAAGAASTIAKLVLDFAVDNESGGGYAAIADLINASNLSIGLLFIESMDPTYISALATSFSGITAIAGPGVLGAGFQIADTLMQSNYPYLSATSPNAGMPVIKVGGVVHSILGQSSATHAEPLTDGNSNFIFAGGDVIVTVGVPN